MTVKVILFLMSFILLSCSQKKHQSCSNFFVPKKSNHLYSCRKINETDSCQYEFKFNFWVGRRIEGDFYSLFDIAGILENHDSILYLKTLPQKKPAVLFDFKMKQSDADKSINIYYKTKGYLGDWIIRKRSYALSVDSIFNVFGRKIYKFRFKKINLFEKDDDMVLYVSYMNGIEGVYCSYFEQNKEKIITKKGTILGKTSILPISDL